MRVVVAPDSFKGSASATVAAQALARGWALERPGDELVLLPMADGGEGTVEAFATAAPGARRSTVPVEGPTGRPVAAEWLLLDDGTAVVELAEASGITLADELRPFDSHTFGFGQVIAAALGGGASRLLLALGGSASTDGGAGALSALGARLLDTTGEPIPLGNRGLSGLAVADLSGMHALPPLGAIVLSDVTNPLLGSLGAAAVFGPQKGASPADVPLLEANLARLAAVLPVNPDAAGAGAAGGAAFGLMGWGATIAAGAPAVGEALGLPAAVASADVVITGEGRFDAQSSAGKVPALLASLAAKNRTPALLVAGRIDAPTDRFAAAVSLTGLAGSGEAAQADACRWLVEAGLALARQFSQPRSRR